MINFLIIYYKIFFIIFLGSMVLMGLLSLLGDIGNWALRRKTAKSGFVIKCSVCGNSKVENFEKKIDTQDPGRIQVILICNECGKTRIIFPY